MEDFDATRWTVYALIAPFALGGFFLLRSAYWRTLLLIATLIFVETTLLGWRPFFSVAFTLTSILAYAMLASFLLIPDMRKRIPDQSVAWAVLIAFALVGAALGSTTRGVTFSMNLMLWQRHFVEALLFFWVGRCAFRDSQQTLDGLTLVVMLAGLAAAVHLFSLATGMTFYHGEIQEGMVSARKGMGEFRNGGVFRSPNLLADFYAMMMPAAVVLRVQRRDLSLLARTALTVAIALMAISAILTASRGGLAAIAVLSLAAALLSGAGLARTLSLAGMAIVVVPVVVGAIALVFPEYLDRVIDRFQTQQFDDSRWLVWRRTFEMMAQHPLGIGPHQETFARWQPQFGLNVGNPHNIYFEVAVAAGIPGLLAFLVLILGVLRRTWAARRYGDPTLRLVAVVIFLMLAGFLLGGVTHPLFMKEKMQRIFFLLAGAASYLPMFIATRGKSRVPEETAWARADPYNGV